MSARWKYDVIEIKPKLMGGFDLEKMREEFDRLGRQGWEMVNFAMQGPAFTAYAVFKKREA